MIDQTAKAGKAVQDDPSLERSYFTSGYDLRDFLRKIALAIQESGAETITQPELEAPLKLPAGRLKQGAKQSAAAHPLSELLISFYFKTGPEHLGCEFLHKIFPRVSYGRSHRRDLESIHAQASRTNFVT